jgi:hypothetical protein
VELQILSFHQQRRIAKGQPPVDQQNSTLHSPGAPGGRVLLTSAPVAAAD